MLAARGLLTDGRIELLDSWKPSSLDFCNLGYLVSGLSPMIDKTSNSALQTLVFLALNPSHEPLSVADLANRLDLSATYLAKVTRMLVKTDVLRSHRGAKGGVSLARPAKEITLLEVVESCQGITMKNYCRDVDQPELGCSYHRAMLELREGVRGTLGRWTLADLLQPPAEPANRGVDPQCSMARVFDASIHRTSGQGSLADDQRN